MSQMDIAATRALPGRVEGMPDRRPVEAALMAAVYAADLVGMLGHFHSVASVLAAR
jgi:hypothetical protein